MSAASCDSAAAWSIPWCVLHTGVGTVVKSTSGKFQEGQRVVSAGRWNGTWQEYALADESSLVSCSDLAIRSLPPGNFWRAVL